MTYYTDLFTPETYEALLRSDRSITGFRKNQHRTATRVKPGDRFICYMTKLSRWVGILEATSECFVDASPRFVESDDPFVIRFKVKPIVLLPKERAIPIHEPVVWERLSFTKGTVPSDPGWTGLLRRSLNRLKESDGLALEDLLRAQDANGKEYPVDEDKYRRLSAKRVRRADRSVTVTVPTDDEDGEPEEKSAPESIRESASVQALLASVGEKMGFKIWLPKNDRSTVLREWNPAANALLDVLPLNYDETTLQTIEQIDVLWLKGRSIVRAFEVEHTTAIYSGILRMADLLALQPNMDIRLHIVAPEVRRDKVFTEIQRPVFSLLDRAPLSECCTFISYDSLRELGKTPHISHLSDSVLEDYEEQAE